ncbi:hypothetical protein PPACK8108_LOCUS22795 [Phakopsora pachyrhizi]|uniref:Uncharacterized protein n=1 Tax=Phakopsora pachyrhizi TaxID=170000 RepID=A0AAV0BPH7_PHAPC|nr:hypothetical protein PPACK8108_LOCUS22795 [Phakopsora pachyrhizi]
MKSSIKPKIPWQKKLEQPRFKYQIAEATTKHQQYGRKENSQTCQDNSQLFGLSTVNRKVKDWGGIEDQRDKDRLPRTTTRKMREFQFRTVEHEEEGSRYNMKLIRKEDETTGEVKDENKRLMETLKEGYVKDKERVGKKIGECCGGFELIELSSRHWQMEFWRFLELSKAINRAGEDLGLPMEVRIWPMVDGDEHRSGLMLAQSGD